MDTKASIDPILTHPGVEPAGAMYLAGHDPRQPAAEPSGRAGPDRLPADAPAGGDSNYSVTRLSCETQPEFTPR